MPIETREFDIQNYLKTPEERAAYIEAALEENDPAFLAKALGDVARAQGMTQVAKDAGVTREALYRALSEKGDPRLSTFMGVLHSLGLKMRIAA
ncbi:addiction module antidote protein [Bosea sp. (in: a-proteobacteria)]|uniref:addiction module antidote protein n=1 Tax=Bosea sp. (in: a-proteobacteria) TaxID=1871050 RepID=UPI0026368698|nr:addiction module antidote protein [Bosea sp. (in: a-proteobacteria)]MCO5092665.1 putative addiction module antidote protein [Bosea sp. (in: a-proteobacteria)]